MIVNAHVSIDLEADDLTEIYENTEDTIGEMIQREVAEAVKKSDAFRDIKDRIYRACIEELRRELKGDQPTYPRIHLDEVTP